VAYTPKHLAERILAEQAAMESRGARDGERKTITASPLWLRPKVRVSRDKRPSCINEDGLPLREPR
jgi:hypothetical protein